MRWKSRRILRRIVVGVIGVAIWTSIGIDSGIEVLASYRGVNRKRELLGLRKNASENGRSDMGNANLAPRNSKPISFEGTHTEAHVQGKNLEYTETHGPISKVIPKVKKVHSETHGPISKVISKVKKVHSESIQGNIQGNHDLNRLRKRDYDHVEEGKHDYDPVGEGKHGDEFADEKKLIEEANGVSEPAKYSGSNPFRKETANDLYSIERNSENANDVSPTAAETESCLVKESEDGDLLSGFRPRSLPEFESDSPRKDYSDLYRKHVRADKYQPFDEYHFLPDNDEGYNHRYDYEYGNDRLPGGGDYRSDGRRSDALHSSASSGNKMHVRLDESAAELAHVSSEFQSDSSSSEFSKSSEDSHSDSFRSSVLQVGSGALHISGSTGSQLAFSKDVALQIRSPSRSSALQTSNSRAFKKSKRDRNRKMYTSLLEHSEISEEAELGHSSKAEGNEKVRSGNAKHIPVTPEDRIFPTLKDSISTTAVSTTKKDRLRDAVPSSDSLSPKDGTSALQSTSARRSRALPEGATERFGWPEQEETALGGQLSAPAVDEIEFQKNVEFGEKTVSALLSVLSNYVEERGAEAQTIWERPRQGISVWDPVQDIIDFVAAKNSEKSGGNDKDICARALKVFQPGERNPGKGTPRYYTKGEDSILIVNTKKGTEYKIGIETARAGNEKNDFVWAIILKTQEGVAVGTKRALVLQMFMDSKVDPKKWTVYCGYGKGISAANVESVFFPKEVADNNIVYPKRDADGIYFLARAADVTKGLPTIPEEETATLGTKRKQGANFFADMLKKFVPDEGDSIVKQEGGLVMWPITTATGSGISPKELFSALYELIGDASTDKRTQTGVETIKARIETLSGDELSLADLQTEERKPSDSSVEFTTSEKKPSGVIGWRLSMVFVTEREGPTKGFILPKLRAFVFDNSCYMEITFDSRWHTGAQCANPNPAPKDAAKKREEEAAAEPEKKRNPGEEETKQAAQATKDKAAQATKEKATERENAAASKTEAEDAERKRIETEERQKAEREKVEEATGEKGGESAPPEEPAVARSFDQLLAEARKFYVSHNADKFGKNPEQESKPASRQPATTWGPIGQTFDTYIKNHYRQPGVPEYFQYLEAIKLFGPDVTIADFKVAKELPEGYLFHPTYDLELEYFCAAEPINAYTKVFGFEVLVTQGDASIDRHNKLGPMVAPQARTSDEENVAVHTVEKQKAEESSISKQGAVSALARRSDVQVSDGQGRIMIKLQDKGCLLLTQKTFQWRKTLILGDGKLELDKIRKPEDMTGEAWEAFAADMERFLGKGKSGKYNGKTYHASKLTENPKKLELKLTAEGKKQLVEGLVSDTKFQINVATGVTSSDAPEEVARNDLEYVVKISEPTPKNLKYELIVSQKDKDDANYEKMAKEKEVANEKEVEKDEEVAKEEKGTKEKEVGKDEEVAKGNEMKKEEQVAKDEEELKEKEVEQGNEVANKKVEKEDSGNSRGKTIPDSKEQLLIEHSRTVGDVLLSH